MPNDRDDSDDRDDRDDRDKDNDATQATKDRSASKPAPRPSQFPVTQKHLLNAARCDTPEGKAAVAELCNIYWYPIFSFFRSQRTGEQAIDLTQGFFESLLRKDDFARFQPELGRFRSWLLAAADNYLKNHWRFERRLCRDKRKEVYIDALSAEQRYLLEPRDGASPERMFNRKFVHAFLEHVTAVLREDWVVRQGRDPELFEVLAQYLPTGSVLDEHGYELLAVRLNITVSALKNRVLRMRDKFLQIFREELRDMVATEQDFADEVELMLKALKKDDDDDD